MISFRRWRVRFGSTARRGESLKWKRRSLDRSHFGRFGQFLGIFLTSWCHVTVSLQIQRRKEEWLLRPERWSSGA